MIVLRVLALALTLLVYAAAGLVGLLSVLAVFILWQVIYRSICGCWQRSVTED